MNSQEFKKTADIASHTFGVCVKDTHRIVIFQNTLCVERCGNKTGKVCEGLCLQKYDECCRLKRTTIEGFCHIPNLSLEYGVADAVVLNDGHQLLTLIYPLEDKHRIKMEYYREKNLTRSELNIVSLLLEGLSNSQIMERLFISKATLKTHINNIYKKIPVEMRPRS